MMKQPVSIELVSESCSKVKSLVQSYGLLKATPFDVRLILLAQLEKLKDEEKAAVISEMKLPKKIKEVALSINCEK